MPTTIEDLPFELLSLILGEAVKQNSKDAVSFTYGLTEAPQPLTAVRIERYVTGQVPADKLRWQTSFSIRRVNRRWHHWALDHSLRELHVSRWRGSERWLEALSLASLNSKPSGMAVYREPFGSLTSTARLFTDYPTAASYVRRLWFTGFTGSKTVGHIFQVLQACQQLQSVNLPWTTVRYGKVADWVKLLERVSSLGLVAVDLKESQRLDLVNQADTQILQHPHITFHHLTRLKISGSTNFKPVTDHDLKRIAMTAHCLEELHVTGMSSVTSDGVMAIVKSSKDSLRVLEFSPLSEDGFDHPDPSGWRSEGHICQALLDCPRLLNVSISVPSLCSTMFSSNDVKWSGELQLRAAAMCDHIHHNASSEFDWSNLYAVLHRARALSAARNRQGADLDIEIFVAQWIFEPGNHRVHGNFDVAEALSDYTWPASKLSSGKGPYGQTGLYGKEERPYSSVSESDFADGLERSYITI